MATPNQAYTFNGTRIVVRLPATGETVNSEKFAVPPGNKVVTVFVPAIEGVASTMKLQALTPNDVVNDTQTWTDLTYFDIADGTFDAIDAFPESTVVSMPVSLMGGGILRWVASADTSAVPADIIMLFSRDG